ncbi:MAG TPA: ABC transporter ATP-binding protein [Verrucomicrobiae bacterium]|jgi:ATP-binding cassette, subfamily B, bacterial|nr:ABC transporter ATP-binding protein [Verrucomicrobiae bacterium]
MIELSPHWQKIRISFTHTPQAFSLVWKTNRPATVGLAFLTLGGALLPAAQAWVGKLIVDGVVAAIQGGQDAEQIRMVFVYLLIELVLFLLATALNHARRLIQQLIQLQLANRIRAEIIGKALTLDLAYFEHPDYYDRLQNARRESGYKPVELINNMFLIVQNVITLLSFAALMLRFSPWLVAILVASSIPAFIAETRFSEQGFRLLTRRAPETRRINYLARLLTEDSAAKEIKLFNLGGNLLGRYTSLFEKFFQEDKTLATRRAAVGFGLGLIATLGFYGSYAWIVWRTVQGSITLGDMTLYLAIFRQGQSVFQSILGAVGNIYESNLFMANYFEFLDLKPQMQTAAPSRKLPAAIVQGVEFRDVGFRYPESDEWVLRGIDLTIRPNEKIALVGHNGAGKTTLIKLLSRLYDPTEGTIFLDGIDIRELDALDLRQKIGVIFQDFVRYHLPARENIGFGQIEAANRIDKIVESARKSGADAIIDDLPEKYDTMLGRWFHGGHELSVGQWQRIALARAFMRDAEILVLDEPTASLDAETEYEIFRHFQQLTDGKMAILISHRFSTVRMAQRIVVLQGGRIAEIGSHEELLERQGVYARLFHMQAEGYR